MFISCCFLRHDKIWNSLSDLVNILAFSLEMHSCWLADKVNWSSTLVFQLPSPSIRVGSKLLRCKKKFAPESICNGTLPYFLYTWSTDYGHPMRTFFFKYPKYFGQLDRSVESIVMYFRVFCVVVFSAASAKKKKVHCITDYRHPMRDPFFKYPKYFVLPQIP